MIFDLLVASHEESCKTLFISFILVQAVFCFFFFFFSSRRRHTRLTCDWSSDVCSSDLISRRCQTGEATGVPAASGGWSAPAGACRPRSAGSAWRLWDSACGRRLPKGGGATPLFPPASAALSTRRLPVRRFWTPAGFPPHRHGPRGSENATILLPGFPIACRCTPGKSRRREFRAYLVRWPTHQFQLFSLHCSVWNESDLRWSAGGCR